MAMRGSVGRERAGRVALAALLAGTVACSKSDSGGKQSSAEPAQAVQHREEAAKLAAPPLFAYIPADTPYVVASFEPLPSSYWQRWQPIAQMVLSMIPEPPASEEPPVKFARALLRDLRADFSEAGIGKLLGVDFKSRFAIYGVGLIPVFRMELSDSKALLATIERLQAESGLALPTATLAGKSYWRFGDARGVVLAAVIDDQLVVSGGPTPMVDKILPLILGNEKPSASMADGGSLKAVAALHGFAGLMIGVVDSANLIKAIAAANYFLSPGAALPPACAEQIAAMGRRFPRFAFGYDEVTDKRVAMRIVLESEAALTERMKQLVVEVPGLVAGETSEPALLTGGLGLDIEKGRQLAVDAVTVLEGIGAACQDASMAEDMTRARVALTQPLPPGVDKIRGAVVSVLDGDLGPDGKPTGVEAFAVIAADDPAALLKMVREQAPAGAVPELAADGKYHPFVPEGAVPGVGAVRAAIKPRALVAAVGARGSDSAERVLARSGPSPLFAMSYDYARIFDKIAKAAGPNAIPAEQKMIFDVFGTVSMWAYPTDHGVALAVAMAFKP